MYDTTNKDDPLHIAEYADVEIYVRPADSGELRPDEQVWESSYDEFARMSTRTIIGNVVETMSDLESGKYEVGIREQGDEQYSQFMSVVEPHAERRGEQLVENHLHGILNHWRA